MTLKLTEMTSPEVSDAIANGVTTVILPLGATEQHGPHLPLGTDSLLAEAIANGLTKVLPKTLVAPTLPIGCSDEHSGFAGLLSLDAQTLAQIVVDCARRMAGWGISRLILFSAHGGNSKALELASDQLRDELPLLQISVLDPSTKVADALLAIAETDGVAAESVGLHAGEGETSEMLFFYPQLVHMERAVSGYTGNMPEILPALMTRGLSAVTRNGVLGDPTAANASRGERYYLAQLASFKEQLAHG